MAQITIYIDSVNKGTYSDVNKIFLTPPSGYNKLKSFKINGSTYTSTYNGDGYTLTMFSDPYIEEHGFSFDTDYTGGAIETLYITTTWEKVDLDNESDTDTSEYGNFVVTVDGVTEKCPFEPGNYLYFNLDSDDIFNPPECEIYPNVVKFIITEYGTTTEKTPSQINNFNNGLYSITTNGEAYIDFECVNYNESNEALEVISLWDYNKLRIYLNGGESSDKTSDYEVILANGQEYTLPALTKSGYRYTGWKLEKIDDGRPDDGIYDSSTKKFTQGYGRYTAVAQFEEAGDEDIIPENHIITVIVDGDIYGPFDDPEYWTDGKYYKGDWEAPIGFEIDGQFYDSEFYDEPNNCVIVLEKDEFRFYIFQANSGNYTSSKTYNITTVWEDDPIEIGDAQNIYIDFNDGKIYARDYQLSNQFYIDNDGTIYAPAFIVDTFFAIGPEGITAIEFIRGLPE